MIQHNMIAVLGGSFDPVHQGHLQIAAALKNQYALSEIRFIPCKQPVIDKRLQATTQQRIAMLRLAIADEPTWHLDTQEIFRRTPSYTQETLCSLRQAFPYRPLLWVMGSDVFAHLDQQWGTHWQNLIQTAHLLVIQRPVQPVPVVSSSLLAWLHQHQTYNFTDLQKTSSGFIYHANIAALPISSTIIRQQLSKGQIPQGLVPDKVLDYIQQQQLYQ